MQKVLEQVAKAEEAQHVTKVEHAQIESFKGTFVTEADGVEVKVKDKEQMARDCRNLATDLTTNGA
jgi:hypothetical protein